jgi:hypothetical protein
MIRVTPATQANAVSMRQAQAAMRKEIAGKLSKSAYGGWYKFGEELRSKVDRPTPFTLRAARYKKATLSVLQAEVLINPIQAEYLAPIIDGQSYRGKYLGKWRPIPLDTGKNRYGNLRANLSKKPAYFTSKRRNKGAKYLGRRMAKNKTKLIAVWKREMPHRKTLDFYGVVKEAVRRSMAST